MPMTLSYGFVDAPEPVAEQQGDTTSTCGCAEPDDQYLLEIDEGSVHLTHQACGKPPRGDWWQDTLSLAQVPVTLTVEPYGNCDGTEWHGEHRCDCGVIAAADVTNLAVLHDDVPYLIGRDYTDRDGESWRITDQRDHNGHPLAYLNPKGAGEPVPLAQVVDEYGPLALVPRDATS
ncbi:phiSA1p31-related protein [Streptomyces sp. NPDC005407]|uniref:phiSA1p31-related protein n=1 Tax=Streptomyces sp. NPDC005407 TaxID=3155340 RepID=UPI0033BEB075